MGLEGFFNNHNKKGKLWTFIAPPAASRGTYIISGSTPYMKPTSTPTEAKAWTELSPKLKLSDRYREKFKAIGYEFGGSVLNVMHCPACPKHAKSDADKAAMKAGIVELLGDDEDGIAATMEDFGL